MFSSLKCVKGAISFEEFCKIINKSELHPGLGNRNGLRDVYNARKKIDGYVTSGDAALVASAIRAQDPEW